MRVDHALHQLSEIHAQPLRSEVFRGYRIGPMASTAVLAVAAAAAQATVWSARDPVSFARLWIAVAGSFAVDVRARPLARHVSRETRR
jgi:hypothetical protein